MNFLKSDEQNNTSKPSLADDIEELSKYIYTPNYDNLQNNPSNDDNVEINDTYDEDISNIIDNISSTSSNDNNVVEIITDSINTETFKELMINYEDQKRKIEIQNNVINTLRTNNALTNTLKTENEILLANIQEQNSIINKNNEQIIEFKNQITKHSLLEIEANDCVTVLENKITELKEHILVLNNTKETVKVKEEETVKIKEEETVKVKEVEEEINNDNKLSDVNEITKMSEKLKEMNEELDKKNNLSKQRRRKVVF